MRAAWIALPLAALLPLGAGWAADWDLSKNWDVTLGGGGNLAPTYEGSNSLHLMPVPYFDIEWNDRLSLSTDDGLHFAFVNWRHLSFGFAGDARLPRRQSDDTALRHLGKVGLSVEVGGYLDYNPQGFDVSFEVRHDIAGGHGGTVAEFNARVQTALSDNLLVEFGPNLNWADKTYMRSYFGIDGGQAAASGYPLFAPGSGFKDIGLTLSAAYLFDEHWQLRAQGIYAYLLGDAAHSPIVDGRGDRNQISFSAVLAYRF